MKIQFVCHDPRWDLTDDIHHTPPICGGRGIISADPSAWEYGQVDAKCPVCRSTTYPQTGDFQVLDHEMPIGVGVLALREGKVLAVSRKTDHTAFGIGGGKVDPTDGDLGPTTFGDTLRRAAAREFREEVGVDLDLAQLEFFYQGVCPGGADGIAYWMVTFLVHELPSEPSTQPGEGVVEWVSWSTLEGGPFGGYNRKLHEKVAEPVGPSEDLYDLQAEQEYMATRIYEGLGIPAEFREP